MKKIFALALAAVMTAGMTTVAFADLEGRDMAFGTEYIIAKEDSDGNFTERVYGDDNTKRQVGTPVVITNVDGGDKIAIKLFKGDSDMTKSEDEKGLKLDASWSVGKGDVTEDPYIDYVKFDDGYCYAVVVTLPENNGTKKADLVGDITVYTTSSERKEPVAAATIALDLSYGYNTDKFDVVEGDMTKAEIVDFSDEEDEIAMDFGDLFTFEVNVTGQGKLNLKNNVDFNKEFAAMYDYANIDFITFENEPTFNKNGTAYIYADEDAFIYEVTADGAKEIKGLKWDEDYDAWTFKTRTLKSYAISDVELDEKTVTEDKNESSKPTEGDKHNPDTGR